MPARCPQIVSDGTAVERIPGVVLVLTSGFFVQVNIDRQRPLNMRQQITHNDPKSKP